MISGATGPITKAISRRRSNRRQWRIFECIFMLILDAILISAAVSLAYWVRFYLLLNSPVVRALQHHLLGNTPKPLPPPDPQQLYPMAVSMVIGLIVIFATRKLYYIRLTGSWFHQAWIILNSTTIGIALLIAYYFAFQNSNQLDQSTTFPNSRLLVPFVWVSVIVILCLGRLIISGVMGMLYRLGLGETRVLVVGSGRLGKMIMQHIAANPNLGFSIVGFLHDMNEPPSDFGRFKMLGTIDDLGLAIRSMQVDEVIIALPSNMNQHAVRSVKMCERLGTTFKLIPDLYELSLSRIDMETIEGIPLIGIRQVSLNTAQRIVTRVVDITVATAALVLGSPLWLLIALIIKVTSPGPIVFKQTRVGLNGQHFGIYKFRSMYQDAEQRKMQLQTQNEAQGPLFKMKSDPRRTPFGAFIRRTSLDEIPQIINIIKGEMSLVGPRPPVPREVAQYEEWQKGRLAIKPGLTGLWQVRGRSDISFDEGVLMDLYYIENWSLRLYFQILLRTIPAVLFSRGAY
ncbi:UDP-phosphate galactose phosphotransferase [Tengunoibacter tsumagoiensis]|uniref:UDP-phosphate galactose phosphotransferase n=2 Tax=Tengunoibacter tsumagoiensis TaxID=2014871 RepID=A0A401ZXW6_9CHLR|nr:UDP-phosphate galactose phosphotransferase [Tengunoibacter tsumagoiensis]